MSGTGRIYVSAVRQVGTIQSTHQYDVDVRFDIAFDYGGWNSAGASYTINCDGQSQNGTDTFSISSGGGSWVWANIGGTKTFRITMPTSGQAKTINFSAGINTGINPSYISASGSYTLSAVTWQWTVSYNANGGSGAPASQTKTYGTNLTLSSVKPTRTGYTFLGWSTSSTATSATYAAGGTYTENAGATLYAVWKINTYTISYNANGGSGAPASQTKTYGTNLTLSSVKPTRTNYNFLGWSTSSSATTAQYAAGGTYTSNAAATLYAVWELAYWNPKFTNTSVARCDSDGTLNSYGTCAQVTFDWECCQITGENNVSSITIQYALSSTSEYTDVSVTASGISGSVSEVIGSDSLSTDNQYDIKIVITDEKGGSTKQTIVLGGAAFTMDFLAGGKGVAVGKPAEMENAFDSAWNAFLRGNLQANGIVSIKGKSGIEGQNLLRGSTPIWGSWITPATDVRNQCSDLYYAYDLSNLKSGTTVAFSFDIEFSGVSSSSSGSFQVYTQDAVFPNLDDPNDGWWNRAGTLHGMNLTSPPEDGVYHFSKVATITDDLTSFKKLSVQIRSDYFGGGKYRVRNMKYEIGSSPTDWSLCPDDGVFSVEGKSQFFGNIWLNGCDIYDQYNTRMMNGLALYTGSGTDAINPNTTKEHLILTDHSNTPTGKTGVFYYITTLFFSSKSDNRAQFAIPYGGGDVRMYHRYYHSGSWSTWKRLVNAGEAPKEWVLLKNQTATGSSTITVDMTLYSEFMIEAGVGTSQHTDYYRTLATTIVPKSMLTNAVGVDHPQGSHQAYYSSSYVGGISYTATNTIKIYNKGGITRLYAR